ncbi:hypothetical protein [Oligoflexus tunisiensis]|uniref:hypothetical protein n=1 Tax=Oligoflexus tunisiensis TaxID=708132 RepID=UPI00114CEEF3|nr:hypothetical protein [Oligoflexus tunisiensis]
MKRLFRTLFVLMSLVALSSAAAAQNVTPDMALKLKEKVASIQDKIQETKGNMPASLMQPAENKLLDQILPGIEQLLVDAGDLFGKAAENLPGAFGEDCLRQGCSKLKDALQLVRKGKRLIRRDGSLKPYAELLDTIEVDIHDATEDAGCRKQNGHHNPWKGKKFRSEYTSPNGSWVKGTTEIHGDSGSYQTHGGDRGSLYSITYRGQGSIAEGYWRFNNGGSGWFSFTLSADGRSFFGSWGDGARIGQHQKGSWKGQL